MQIAVIGAGSMGSLYGGYISKKNEVYLIDLWEEHIESINEKGLIIEELNGEKNLYTPRGYTNSAMLPIMDVVIIFVKSIYTDMALKQHQNLIGNNTILLSLQNGYGNYEDMKLYASEERIIMGTTSHGCTMKGPGHVFHAGLGGTFIGSFNEDQRCAEKVKKILVESGFDVEVKQNVEEIIFEKLFINIAINPLTALLDVDNLLIKTNLYLNMAAKDLVHEAVDIVNNEKFCFDTEKVFQLVNEVAEKTGANCSSMRADILNHRKTEIEKINGAIVKLAKRQGKNAPINEQIVRLIKAKEEN